MRGHQYSTWLTGLTALLAGIALAVGSAGCEPSEGVYEGTEQEPTGTQQEPIGQQQADQQIGQQQADQQQADQQQADQQQADQQVGPQQANQQQAGQQQDDTSLENLNPSQISDQDLAQFAQLQLKLTNAREEGAVGGGPVEDEELKEWETEMIQSEGMGVDRFLAIRMMLQDEPELQRRYEQVLGQIHTQPDQQQQQQGQPQPSQPQ